MADVVIEAKGLTRRFGDFTAVDAIDLEVRRGEIFGLLGPNGAGKTTTINMLVTILRPSGGTGRVNGFDVASEPELVRRSVGIVFQEPSIDTLLTARENLELHGRLYGVPRAQLKERVREMLALVNLEERAHVPVKQFSGGMKRRLEIARGLMHEPAVIFLDEPTLGLDPATREHIWEHIRRLRETRGTTLVLTTHYMDEADRLCDRLAIIDHGKIVASGTPRDLKAALGGDIVIVRLGPKGAEDRLAALPFVDKVERKDGALHLAVRGAAARLPEIVTAAGDVAAIEVRSPTLEDVFIHHTGRGLRDTEGDGESDADQMVRFMNQGSGR